MTVKVRNTDMNSERQKALENAMHQITREFGAGAIMRLGDMKGKLDTEVIPTGSLAQEMQWMDCGYLNSAEYFHGPFEVTDEDHLYILMMSRGRNRMMDERVLTFLEKYGKKYEVIDADKLGMEAIDDSCVEYFTPMLFYTMTTVYRTALQDKRRHPLDMRRYMGVVEY